MIKVDFVFPSQTGVGQVVFLQKRLRHTGGFHLAPHLSPTSFILEDKSVGGKNT